MIRKLAITLAIVHFSTSAVAATIDKRIVNGEAAKAGDVPSIVSVKSSRGIHICGGLLLDSHTVLTAAHCLGSGDIGVKAGSLNKDTGGVDAKVASKKAHPGYPTNYQKGVSHALHDIGILKLSTPIEESETIKYATLPPDGSDPQPNSTAIIAGWGNRKEMVGGESDVLLKAEIPVFSREDCRRVEPDSVGDIDTIVCAGGSGDPTGNVCKFDSGGPLLDSKTGQLIGLAALVLEATPPEVGRASVCNTAPSVFTRVGSYIPFITENLGKPVNQQLEDHCGRPGNDNKACMDAAKRCAGQVKPDTTGQVLLECTDNMQACADQKLNTDKCVENAKACKEKQKIPLGDVARLAQCAKQNL